MRTPRPFPVIDFQNSTPHLPVPNAVFFLLHHSCPWKLVSRCFRQHRPRIEERKLPQVLRRKEGEVKVKDEKSEKQKQKKSREPRPEIFPSGNSLTKLWWTPLLWAKCYVWCLIKASPRADAMVNTSEKTWFLSLMNLQSYWGENQTLNADNGWSPSDEWLRDAQEHCRESKGTGQIVRKCFLREGWAWMFC